MTWTDREVEKKTYDAFSRGYKTGAEDTLEEIRQQIINTINDNYEDEDFYEAMKTVLEIIDAQEGKK